MTNLSIMFKCGGMLLGEAGLVGSGGGFCFAFLGSEVHARR